MLELQLEALTKAGPTGGLNTAHPLPPIYAEDGSIHQEHTGRFQEAMAPYMGIFFLNGSNGDGPDKTPKQQDDELRVFHSRTPDDVVMVGMPGTAATAIETFERLRKIHPHLIPVLTKSDYLRGTPASDTVEHYRTIMKHLEREGYGALGYNIPQVHTSGPFAPREQATIRAEFPKHYFGIKDSSPQVEDYLASAEVDPSMIVFLGIPTHAPAIYAHKDTRVRPEGTVFGTANFAPELANNLVDAMSRNDTADIGTYSSLIDRHTSSVFESVDQLRAGVAWALHLQGFGDGFPHRAVRGELNDGLKGRVVTMLDELSPYLHDR